MREIAVHLAVVGGVCDGVFLCCLFSHGMSWMRAYLIESVSEGFPTYSYISPKFKSIIKFLENALFKLVAIVTATTGTLPSLFYASW